MSLAHTRIPTLVEINEKNADFSTKRKHVSAKSRRNRIGNIVDIGISCFNLFRVGRMNLLQIVIMLKY